MRGGNRDVEFVLENLDDSLLVAWIGIRVEERDRDAFGGTVPNLCPDLADGFFVDCLFDGVRRRSLGNLEAATSRNQRLRTARREVVQVWTVLSADFENVAEAFGCDERRLCARLLQKGG